MENLFAVVPRDKVFGYTGIQFMQLNTLFQLYAAKVGGSPSLGVAKTLLANATPSELKGIHASLIEGLGNGTLRPFVGQELPLAEAARAHELIMEPGHSGKIVLVP